jgi:hypothetical protein
VNLVRDVGCVYLIYGCQMGCQWDVNGMSNGMSMSMSKFGCQFNGCLQDQ